MAGGAYTALSGLRTRIEQLDRLAADLANSGTAGYKSERTTTVSTDRPTFRATLESAIDVAPGPGRIDFREGTILPTGRDLDFALDGDGFFVVNTPQGPRYTRNGQFDRSADGTLIALDGSPVAGESGEIKLGAGTITVDPDGTIRTGSVVAGKLQIVNVADPSQLQRESTGRFRPADGMGATSGTAKVRSSALEQSNVSVMDRMAQLTELGRGFEALQRGVTVLLNDIDGRAISELGRR